MIFIKRSLIVVLLIMSFSCTQKKEVPTVKLGHAPHDHHATLYVAAAKQEYFDSKCSVFLKEVTYKKDYQLYKDGRLIANIKIDSGTGGIQLIRKLDEKILDVTFGGVPAMIDMIDKGSRIKIVAPVMTDGDALVVRKDMPVSGWKGFVDYVRNSKTPVRIGYKAATSVQNLIFEAALKNEHLSFSRDINAPDVDVIVVNLHGPKNLLPALEAGVIDGYVIMQPYPAIAEHSKEGKVISELKNLPPKGQWTEHPCCALAAGDDFIKDHGEIIESLIVLFDSAGKYIIKHPKESAEITARWLGTPVKVEELSLPTINFTETYTSAWNRGVSFWVQSLIKSGELTGEVKKAYESSGLDGVIYNKRFYYEAEKRLKSNVNK